MRVGCRNFTTPADDNADIFPITFNVTAICLDGVEKLLVRPPPLRTESDDRPRAPKAQAACCRCTRFRSQTGRSLADVHGRSAESHSRKRRALGDTHLGHAGALGGLQRPHLRVGGGRPPVRQTPRRLEPRFEAAPGLAMVALKMASLARHPSSAGLI